MKDCAATISTSVFGEIEWQLGVLQFTALNALHLLLDMAVAPGNRVVSAVDGEKGLLRALTIRRPFR